jgi:hypothetical protein
MMMRLLVTRTKEDMHTLSPENTNMMQITDPEMAITFQLFPELAMCLLLVVVSCESA